MEILIPTFVNGIVIGMIYALTALGFTLIFGISRILNFAHGEIYMLGAVITYVLYEQNRVPFILALALSMLLLGALGVLLERGIFRHLRGNPIAVIIASVGLLIIIPNAVLLIFGERDKAIATVFPGVVSALGINVSMERVAVVAIATATVVLLYLFVHRTNMGGALRAVQQDEEIARLQGVNVNHVNMLTFALAFGLAAEAGALMAPIFVINPFIGGSALFKALLVVILGGLGSIPGAIVGGLILGLITSFSYSYIGGGFATIIGFIAIIVVLLVKPRGILGREIG